MSTLVPAEGSSQRAHPVSNSIAANYPHALADSFHFEIDPNNFIAPNPAPNSPLGPAPVVTSHSSLKTITRDVKSSVQTPASSNNTAPKPRKPNPSPNKVNGDKNAKRMISSAHALLEGYSKLPHSMQSQHVLGNPLKPFGLGPLGEGSAQADPMMPFQMPAHEDMLPNDSLLQAAIAARLPINSMSPGEHKIFGKDFGREDHLVSYLEVRNKILRAFYMQPSRSLSLLEAFNATQSHSLDMCASVYFFLVRYSYINFGLVRPPNLHHAIMSSMLTPQAPRPKTFVIIGAGMAGLACARQLRQVFENHSSNFQASGVREPPPIIIILESRQRIGGRVYTHSLFTKARSSASPFASTYTTGVDLGAKVVSGWEGGNPIKVLKQQLNLTTHDITKPTQLFDIQGQLIDEQTDVLCETIFNQALEETTRMRTKTAESRKSNHNQRKRGSVASRSDGKEVDESLKPKAHPEVPSGLTEKPRKRRDSNANPGSIAKNSEPLSLGAAFDKALRDHPRYNTLNDRELRIIQWHLANLEFANSTSINNLSLQQWDQDDEHEFFGQHSMFVGGFGQLAHAMAYGCRPLGCIKENIATDRLDIRMGVSVVQIDWHNRESSGLNALDETNVIITCEDGSRFAADACVVTVPLGVLKSTAIKFEPELPQQKLSSIQRLGFGVLNKVVLVFREPFWDVNTDTFGFLNPQDLETGLYETARGKCFLFWNMTPVVKLPVLIALLAGEAAVRLEQQPDQTIVKETLDVLQRLYDQPIPSPLETIVTRWSYDEHSRGSYSYVGVGATGSDYDVLAEPIDQTLFFAGEHTCREYPATVHGAFISGMRAAAQIGNSFLGEIELQHNININPMKLPHVLETDERKLNLSNHPVYHGPLFSLSTNFQSSHGQKGPATDTCTKPGFSTSMPHELQEPAILPAMEPGLKREMEESSNFDTRVVPKKAKTSATRRRKNEKLLSIAHRKCLITIPREWKYTGKSIPCVVPDCKMISNAPVEFHKHLISHIPDEEKAVYCFVNEKGEFPSLPDDLMPALPKQCMKNPFLLYLKIHWDATKKEVKGDHHSIRTYLARKWGELEKDEKQNYLSEIERLRKDHKKRLNVFHLQCSALGITDYFTEPDISSHQSSSKNGGGSASTSLKRPNEGASTQAPRPQPIPSDQTKDDGEVLKESTQDIAPTVPTDVIHSKSKGTHPTSFKRDSFTLQTNSNASGVEKRSTIEVFANKQDGEDGSGMQKDAAQPSSSEDVGQSRTDESDHIKSSSSDTSPPFQASSVSSANFAPGKSAITSLIAQRMIPPLFSPLTVSLAGSSAGSTGNLLANSANSLNLPGTAISTGMPSSYLMYQTAHRFSSSFESPSGVTNSSTSSISLLGKPKSPSSVTNGSTESIGNTPRPPALQSYFDIVNTDEHYQQFLLQRHLQQQQQQHAQSKDHGSMQRSLATNKSSLLPAVAHSAPPLKQTLSESKSNHKGDSPPKALPLPSHTIPTAASPSEPTMTDTSS
jgi:monoamine oxidase